MATVYQYKEQGKPKVQVLILDLTKVLPDWTLDGNVCGSPLKWAPDFSQYLIAGTPPGSHVSHVVNVDVRAGTYRDLTAPRQKSGFSDPVLNEDRPLFISDHASKRAQFGSNVVFLHQSTDTQASMIVVDRRTPEKSTPMPVYAAGDLTGVPVGHLEGSLRGDPVSGVYDEWSPDGAYLASRYSVLPAANPSTQIPIQCPEFYTGVPADTLGWTDATHVIYTDGRSASLVTVTGTPVCQPLIPKTDKFISDIHRSEDGYKLYFKARNASGGTTEYSVPADAPGSQPIADALPEAPLHTLYRPGNF